jgi:hypothetical protein
MSNEVKSIKAIKIPVEKLIIQTEREFSKYRWFEKRVDNIPVAVEFAVEDFIVTSCFMNTEFEKKLATLKEEGKYDTAPYIMHLTRGFAQLHQGLKENTKEYSPAQEATKEVSEKVVRPIGEEIIVEVCVDNPFIPEVETVIAYK